MTLPSSKTATVNTIVPVQESYSLKEFGETVVRPAAYAPDGTLVREGMLLTTVNYGNAVDAGGNLVVLHSETVRWEDQEYRDLVSRNQAAFATLNTMLAGETP